MTAPTNRQNVRFPLQQWGRPHMTPQPCDPAALDLTPQPWNLWAKAR